ncbi:uncharacterized protein [Rutidosis leptorrhynchoides]|uniref:uncharacterized protein n=1 Tax=Rutidosis leptorrhynchoides TaxID=125765 RepID=UPI003A99637F
MRKEKREAQAEDIAKLLRDVYKTVRLVDALIGIPNYGKFIKYLLAQKGNYDDISTVSLSEECSTILSKVSEPPKLGDRGSINISCILGNNKVYDALVDLGASINLMSYSPFKKLGLGNLTPTKMGIRLAIRSFNYPVGVAADVLVKIHHFTFFVDFVVLEMEEDLKVHLILGRTFLNTADDILHIKKRELDLDIGDQ